MKWHVAYPVDDITPFVPASLNLIRWLHSPAEPLPAILAGGDAYTSLPQGLRPFAGTSRNLVRVGSQQVWLQLLLQGKVVSPGPERRE